MKTFFNITKALIFLTISGLFVLIVSSLGAIGFVIFIGFSLGIFLKKLFGIFDRLGQVK